MDAKETRLGDFLKEVSNWQWDEFCRAEKDDKFTSNEAIIFSLIRACTMQKLEAIRLSLNRLDGKLKTPVVIEYPKIYFVFPNAKAPVGLAPPLSADAPTDDPASALTGELVTAPETGDGSEGEEDLPSMSLRETLAKMGSYPRQLPNHILELATQTEDAIHNRGSFPEPTEIPRVKSVVAASLLNMAHKRDLNAMTEVFDQIDGKLAETLQIIGDDIYITSYATETPEGATPNKDGVLQIQAPAAEALWAQKLGRVG